MKKTPRRRGHCSTSFRKHSPVIAGFADRMSSRMSEPEFRLWKEWGTGTLGYRLLKQHPVNIWNKWAIIDFYTPQGRFALEVDDPSHGEPKKRAMDAKRSQLMSQLHRITTLRIRNETVLYDVDYAATALLAVMRHIHEGAALLPKMPEIYVEAGPCLDTVDGSLRVALAWA